VHRGRTAARMATCGPPWRSGLTFGTVGV
jgi:hypothetical protein